MKCTNIIYSWLNLIYCQLIRQIGCHNCVITMLQPNDMVVTTLSIDYIDCIHTRFKTENGITSCHRYQICSCGNPVVYTYAYQTLHIYWKIINCSMYVHALTYFYSPVSTSSDFWKNSCTFIYFIRHIEFIKSINSTIFKPPASINLPLNNIQNHI